MAVTQQEHDDFLAAYGASPVAREAFEANMLRALRGEEVNVKQIALHLSALKRLHTAWQENSLPMTTFKRA